LGCPPTLRICTLVGRAWAAIAGLRPKCGITCIPDGTAGCGMRALAQGPQASVCWCGPLGQQMHSPGNGAGQLGWQRKRLATQVGLLTFPESGLSEHVCALAVPGTSACTGWSDLSSPRHSLIGAGLPCPRGHYLHANARRLPGHRHPLAGMGLAWCF